MKSPFLAFIDWKCTALTIWDEDSAVTHSPIHIHRHRNTNSHSDRTSATVTLATVIRGTDAKPFRC